MSGSAKTLLTNNGKSSVKIRLLLYLYQIYLYTMYLFTLSISSDCMSISSRPTRGLDGCYQKAPTKTPARLGCVKKGVEDFKEIKRSYLKVSKQIKICSM